MDGATLATFALAGIDADKLARAIAAVDALNSWVRSPSYRDGYFVSSGPKRAIYHMKRQALRAAHAVKWCTHRRVGVIALCRCKGTGKYTPWYEGAKERDCRYCSGRGRVILYFVETEIRRNGQWWNPLAEWHTPADQFPGDLYTPGENGWYDAGGWPTETRWQPNQPGRDLTVPQAAELLNLAEGYFTIRPAPRVVCADYATFRVDDFAYQLHLGDTDPAVCSLCGKPAREGGYGVSRGRVCWRDHACQECEGRFDRSATLNRATGRYECNSIFDAFPEPAALLADRHVREWVDRHPAKEKTDGH